MAAPYYLLMILIVVAASLVIHRAELSEAAGQPPSPGFYPSSRVGSISFNQGYKTLWGGQHQKLEEGTLSLWLDRSSGSGFKSLTPYKSGYYGVSMKLHPGYTAGVITSFYLSNQEDLRGHHDEVDIEFLGTTPGKPYTLQTNVYIRGSGDGSNKIGRENRYHLWFDPTQDFHRYSILWTPLEIIFLVDDIPIRRYPKRSDATFPTRPMWVYGSIWDASSWATEAGRYKADYRYQPFVAKYKDFKLKACPATTGATANCSPPSVSPSGSSAGLSRQQLLSMQWVQRNYLVYDYCTDSKRNHAQTPEC